MHSNKVIKALPLIPVDSARPISRVLGAGMLVRFQDKGISDYSDEEFAQRVAAGVDRLISAHPGLGIPDDEAIYNVFGHGQVVETLSDGERGFFWLHDFAEQMGIEAPAAQKIARQEYLHDLESQREADLEHDTVGWDRLRWWPMHVSAWTGPGHAEEHYVNGSMSGQVAANYTDLWLVDSTLITYLALLSPHGKEIQKAAEPMFAHALRKSGLGELADALGGKDFGVSEEESVRKAMRGPRPSLTVLPKRE